MVVTTIHAMRSPLTTKLRYVQESIEVSSSSTPSSAGQEDLRSVKGSASSSDPLDNFSKDTTSSKGTKENFKKKSRQWAHRIQSEKRLTTKVFPLLEKWVQEAGKDDYGDLNGEIIEGVFGDPIMRPRGLLELKARLDQQLSNARRYKDPLFETFIDNVVNLKKDLPALVIPKLPPDEARARKQAVMERYLIRQKVKAHGVDVQASHLNKGRLRGYKENEPGYERQLAIMRRQNEARKRKRREEKEASRVVSIKVPVWGERRSRSEKARLSQADLKEPSDDIQYSHP